MGCVCAQTKQNSTILMGKLQTEGTSLFRKNHMFFPMNTYLIFTWFFGYDPDDCTAQGTAAQ